MTSDEIRERYLEFFQERDHKRLPSASLIPSASDRSVLLTTAGMQPLVPYFLGRETPPASRLCSCQKCFRTVDIDKVGSTRRHITCFEMLGNFSIGDYFKQGAIEFAWELSREVFGFDEQDIWVTVFAGDEQLGLGPDDEAIELWQAAGVGRERIVLCPRSENFWEAGAVGPSGPCSELYLDRGLDFGSPEDLPGGENERFLEFWNLVFMQYNQEPHDHLEPLPAMNIDTGLGLNRMATILQGKDSIFETDQFQPLIDLGEELSGSSYGTDKESDRALRILADHARGMSFLIADGVVPSNEERGYVLRRVMRRAILQGRTLGMQGGFLVRYARVVRELMGGAYPELTEQREAIEKWLDSEEQSFGHTIEQGTRQLDELIAQARQSGARDISAKDAFTLHDTYGFPFDLTRELLAEHGLGVDPQRFELLMDEQRARARAAAAGGGGSEQGSDPRELARRFAESVPAASRFTGYETETQSTQALAVENLDAQDGRYLVKLADSPFYAAGGGQISDAGVIECEHGDCRARVDGVYRLGDDQALSVVLERGQLKLEEPLRAQVDHAARHATEANHTATHLLHAALRDRLGSHVRQAGSYVGPDKLRFDFSHSAALTQQELRDVEDQVNAWIVANDPVRAITTTLQEAKQLGAMALFGEKYGDVVRMVQIGEGNYSRELCGGTHVRSTAQIGLFRIISETSSAANVRRIEALTGPRALELLLEHDRLLAQAASELRTAPSKVPEVLRERERQRKTLLKSAQSPAGNAAGAPQLESLLEQAEQLEGANVLAATVAAAGAKALVELTDLLRGRLPNAAIVLGSSEDQRVHLVASVDPELVKRGVKAAELVKLAAELTGGGGGGRDTMAQAGGNRPEKLTEALQAARERIHSTLSG